jgi:hypothetical protein
LSIEDKPLEFDMKKINSILYFNAVSTTGISYVWKLEEFQKGVLPDLKIGDNETKVKIGKFSHENEHGLIIGLNSYYNPLFQTYNIFEKEGVLKNKIELKTEKKEKEKEKEKKKVSILGSLNMEDPNARFKSNFDTSTINEKINFESKKFKEKENEEKIKFTNRLSNALKFNDNSLITECLIQSDEEIIKSTVKDLDTILSFPLLECILMRYETQEVESSILVIWIRAVLMTHTTFILSHKNIISILSPLYQSIDKRLKNFNSLIDLSGRLDLLLSLGGNKNVGFDANEDDVEDDEDVEEEVKKEKIINVKSVSKNLSYKDILEEENDLNNGVLSDDDEVLDDDEILDDEEILDDDENLKEFNNEEYGVENDNLDEDLDEDLGEDLDEDLDEDEN